MPPYPEQAANQASAAHIGRWIIPAIPFGWTWIPDFGIQKAAEGAVPSNVYLKEDELLGGDQLILYIQTQITLMKRTFLEPTIAGPAPLQFPGADESAMLMLKHQPMNQVTVIQVQHYVRAGKWIGIATLTTTETELLKVRPDFEQFMKLLRIEPAAPAPLTIPPQP
ncbi:MAG TPA: hypothetical protein VKH40_07495 [Alloacidobacterium sp.]|nr:hypothetical protein [Alloacidobacterium sp.]